MKRASLFFGDIAVLYLSLFITLLIRYGFAFEESIDIHLLPFTIIFIFWLLVFYIDNLYDLGYAKNNIHFFSSLFYSLLVNTIISLFFFYFVQIVGIAPKTNFFIFTVVVTAFLGGWRYYFNRSIARSGFKNNTLIIGNSEQSQELYDFLLANPQLGYNAKLQLDPHNIKNAIDLMDIINRQAIRAIVVADNPHENHSNKISKKMGVIFSRS